jgi:hypothetical protein
MARDKDTPKNFIVWDKEEFGFTANAATALHDVQMHKDALTLSQLDNDAVANICKVISKDTGQSDAKIATTKIKVSVLLDQAPAPYLKKDWWDPEAACESEVRGDHRPPATAEARRGQLDFR